MKRAVYSTDMSLGLRLIVISVVVAGSPGAFAAPRIGSSRVIVIEPAAPAEPGAISNVIFLERCRGGCIIRSAGINDAVSNQSSLPDPGTYTVGEFKNAAGDLGAAADAEWGQIVQCVREVYSPYAVTVTDVKPASGTYHAAVIAGLPGNLGLPGNVLGVAPLAGNCSALDNVMSFSFANAHPQTETTARVQNICWTASQESAHAFGLDHQFAFTDGRSACNDPMTYRVDCGGQKFFRNALAKCGEDTTRNCRCTTNQNSHKKLLSVFGPGTPLTGPPTMTMLNPPADGQVLPDNVIGMGGAQRGISRVQLFLNGFPYVEVAGLPFGPTGQPLNGSYGLLVPRETPNSIYDVFLRAEDDLGFSTDSATVTVTHNAPCEAATECLEHQKCEAGRCFWDPPVGEIGDSCSYPQYCKSLLCVGTTEEKICTQKCDAEDPLSCPTGLECNSGVCFPPDVGGCFGCTTGGGSLAQLSGFAGLLLYVLRRRRVRS